MTDDVQAVWTTAERHMAAARRLLSGSPDTLHDCDEDGSPVRHDDYLEHGELGLALDELVDLAGARAAAEPVWRELSAAGRAMGIGPEHPVHGSRAALVRNVLAAHPDEEQIQSVRALLNGWDPIGIEPGVEGPTDEYDCFVIDLLLHLHAGEGVDELWRWLRWVLEGHFGLDPDTSQPRLFAQRLVDWYARNGEHPAT